VTSTLLIHSPCTHVYICGLGNPGGRENPPGAPLSGFGDLNSSDTFPLVQMLTFKPLEALVGKDSPGNSFSGFGDLNSPGTFPLEQMPTFEPSGDFGGGDLSGKVIFRFW
jgi:hypothetical protein